MIFRMNEEKNERMNDFFMKSIDELNDFFEVNWKKNLPKLVILDNICVADKVFEEQFGKKRANWTIGWIEEMRKVIVLDKNHCNQIKSEKGHFALIKHELVHSFTLVYCMKNKIDNIKMPVWIWEGMAMYLSGQLDGQKIKKFEKVLESFDSYGDRVYQESGFVIDLLIKRYGKEKLFELLKGFNDINSEDEFKELFKENYGFALNYKNLNELLGDKR